jgi:sugar (pentulose or hexulose) kinase
MWIRKNDPGIFKSARYFISTLEFMNLKLTGKNIIDPTNAAIRQIMDIQTGRWDSETLDFIGIDEKRLPEIMPSGGFIGTLTKKAAADLGLPETVKIYNGAHDQYCSAIGSGTLNPGEMLLATGTTWVAFGVTEKPFYTKSRIAPGIFPLTGYFGAIASMASAGSALKWWKNIISGSYADIDSEAEKRTETAADLLFYPYVAGAGILHGPNEKAGLSGMTLRHDKYDIARALMEGVAFEARLLLEEFARNGMKTRILTMTGGGANSKLWREITGYVTRCGIILTEETEAACAGAAMTAAAGLGLYPDLHSCLKSGDFVKRRQLDLQDKRQYEFYEDKFNRYCDKFKN